MYSIQQLKRLRTSVTLLALMVLSLPLSAQTAAQKASEEQLVIHGSATLGEHLAVAWISDWLASEQWQIKQHNQPRTGEHDYAAMKGNQRLRISLRSAGTGTGFDSLARGVADIAMASRPINPAELVSTVRFGDLREPGLEHVVALDSLAVVVHPSRSLPALSIAQVREIFAGRVTTWTQLGQPGGAIGRYLRDEKSGTYDAFRAMVMNGENTAVATRFSSSDGLSDAVAADPNSIGVVSVSAIRKARILGIDVGSGEVARPTLDSVSMEEYPLTRRLFLYHKPGLSANARRLLAFALSPVGQKIAEQEGFVGIKVRRSKQVDVIASASEEYRALAQNAVRLSVNFRFNAHSDEILDSKAVFDIERVTQFMRQDENRGGRLQIIGFARGAGPDVYSQVSAENWADLVAQQLVQRGVPIHQVRGLVAPAAAASGASEGLNWVEVWWRPRSEIATTSTARRASP